jgi:hypothetical protein
MIGINGERYGLHRCERISLCAAGLNTLEARISTILQEECGREWALGYDKVSGECDARLGEDVAFQSHGHAEVADHLMGGRHAITGPERPT